MIISSLCAISQTVTLISGNNHVRIDKIGTVTFSGQGITLEEVAKRENLTHVSGRTYRAAIIYDIAFSKGTICSQGKIFNCTDNSITVICTFYNGNNQIASYSIPVKARTFNRMVPDNVSFSSLQNCNKIICRESGVSVGTVSNIKRPAKRQPQSNSSLKSFFTKETIFFGENSTNRMEVTYFQNGTCFLYGHILEDGYWVRGTSNGKYFIKNNTIYVTWDDCIHESYKLINNQYNNDGIIFRLQ